MSITFQDLCRTDQTAAWMDQPFNGFSLDSRKIESGQIFIALHSFSQPEKMLQFAQSALARGALAVISEADLALQNSIVMPDVRQLMGQWQKRYLQAIDPVHAARILAVTGTNGKTTISRLVAELLL